MQLKIFSLIVIATLVPVSGCSVMNRLDAMNGSLQQVIYRLDYANARLDSIAEANAKLDQANATLLELNQQIALVQQRAAAMDEKLGTMESFAKRFGAGR